MFRATQAMLIGCLLLLPVVANSADPEFPTAAFVGQLISIKEVPNKCVSEDPELECIPVGMDEVFEANYKVIEVLAGTIRSKEISFKIADHFGFPAFAEYQHALLFVTSVPDENWLQKYQGFPVHRTTSDSWAYCGNPRDERGSGAPPHVQPIAFASDLGVVGDFSKEGIAKRFADERYISTVGGRIKCHTGVLVADLYEMSRNGALKSRGIQMPELHTSRKDP